MEEVAWQQKLKAAGIKTAILSNMGDTVLESIEREFQWVHGFDVLIWSFQLKMAKPDPAIYHAVLDRLGVPAEETLFIDDKQENIEAARKLGMTGVLFTNIERLREDLVKERNEVPLPEPRAVEVRGA